MHISEKTLEKLLLDAGVLTAEAFAAAKDEAIRTGQSVQATLVGTHKLEEQYLMEIISPYAHAPIVTLERTKIPPETLRRISELFAKTRGVILFEEDKKAGIGKLGMLDPLNYGTIEHLRFQLGLWIEPYLMSHDGFTYALKQYRSTISQDFHAIISESVDRSQTVVGSGDLAKTAASTPIITILDSILEYAVEENASDVHFEPLGKELLVRFRIDGLLHEIVTLPGNLAPILVARVKILTNLQIDEHRAPQDGRFRFDLSDATSVDVRVNIIPVFHGEKVEMRVLKSAASPLSLEDLGLSVEGGKLLREELKKPHGMVLATGPTGHGKTTTLYAMLSILNTTLVNITTIEDPIEYEFPRINQTQVNAKAGITFANGLRALLRQNPDIIMIGEIRDNETVEIAVHAALTGHLVLSSLHTNDAPSALPRLLDMGAPAFLLASTVNLVIAQRLVRRICRYCVTSVELSGERRKQVAEEVKAIAGIPESKLPQYTYQGMGCEVCNGSGFRGQIGIFELFRVTDPIRELVLKSAPVEAIRKKAIEEGMTPMFEDGFDKVERGITTLEEIFRVVRE